MTTTPDLWHHYGRTRSTTDRTIPGAFRWTWDPEDDGPGADLLGDLTDQTVCELGAGAARQAAYLATHHTLTRVDAVDSSPAQHAIATTLYSALAPRLRLVHRDVVTHLHAEPDGYDVLYSVFGAVDFTDPTVLLPAAARALRPGGRLVFATLAHYVTGAPAQPDVTAVDIPAKTPDGESATMTRWVLQEHVWTKVLDQAGFTRISAVELPAGPGPKAAATLIMTAATPTG
ncbi:class I SAM-dependent methyltransferase [Streptomyces sp. NPDC048623]|uniref:class I SAM-dependent methyltransferase n=1 Tax=Streptomyces sp. NPDC048623 TaxID=3155761 RepID=UPI00341390BE